MIRICSTCVYAIKHTFHLNEAIATGGTGTFIERRPWVGAERLVARGGSEGETVPIVFAPAEETNHVVACGTLTCNTKTFMS
jgi:hypothetical protein